MDRHSPLAQKALTELRRRTPELFQEARDQGVAFLVTDRGEAAGVIMGQATWDLLNARLDLMEQIALGMQDVAEGRLTEHDAVRAEFAQWL